ncbi:MAG: hypothetical protein U0441_07445 [Polyangiaceae bacterium]
MSASLPTKDIAVFVDAVDDGSGYLTVTASLEARAVDNENYVRLSPGDTLSTTYAKKTYGLSETGDGHYAATIPLGDEADVGVAMNRSKYTNAPASGGVLPESVELDLTGAVISRSLDDLVLDLPETVGFKSVDIEGPCISSSHYDVGTNGDYLTVPAGAIYASYVDDECYVDVTVSCELAGTPDPALNKQSRIGLRRTRTTTFYSVP